MHGTDIYIVHNRVQIYNNPRKKQYAVSFCARLKVALNRHTQLSVWHEVKII